MVELTNMLTYFVMVLNLNWRPVKSSFPQISIRNLKCKIFLTTVKNVTSFQTPLN